jgi:hypothetical protein
MRYTALCRWFGLFILGISATAMAQPGGGPGGGGPGGGFGFGGPGGRGGRDALAETISQLGELNLTPGFTLTEDQKQQIQAVRDEFKKQQDKWAADHADEIKKINDQFQALRQAGGPPDPQQMQDIFQSRQQLYATAPSSDDAAAAIMAILKPDQAPQLKAKLDAAAAQRQQMRGRFGGGGPGGGGPGGGGPGGGGQGGGPGGGGQQGQGN